MSAALWWSLLASYVVKTPPNIIVIVADDLGWNDVGWNNQDIKTPNLNALAYKGVILNNSYVSQACSPSRAALLTGKYPFKLGLQHGVLKKNKPHGLPLGETLLPQKLKELGYDTHMIGKWHLGFCNWNYTPTFRGFDTFYGFYSGQQDYYRHKTNGVKGYDFRYNTKIYRPPWGSQKYSSMDFARHASNLILNHRRKTPMFMYLSFQAPHTPLQVPKKFEEMYSHIANKHRRLFSGMVTAMDSAIGNVMRALRKRKMNENTIIAFLSDNGGTPFGGGNNWPLRGGKGTYWEGGTRVPSFVWGKPLKKYGYRNTELMHITDWFPTLLSVAGGKADRSIDGMNQWPTLSKGLPSNRTEFVYGLTSKTGKAALRVGKYKLIEGSAGHYSDWFPPPTGKGRYIKLEKNKNRLGERHLNYTLLFNIKEDPIESNNLAYTYPDIVATMKKKLTYYKTQEREPFNPRKVRKANPKFWNGVWSPGWC